MSATGRFEKASSGPRGGLFVSAGHRGDQMAVEKPSGGFGGRRSAAVSMTQRPAIARRGRATGVAASPGNVIHVANAQRSARG